ncbi:Thioredoxin-like fold [Senna tora]|uniref:Thioredoxin-like fold n=1 Tax=Senna tora TaxID=362788 RepID=A0A834ST53_9FABA|nr:Thioredoxin-like fold [Senna tora]
MGCASSKEKRCRHCNAPYSPVPRSYSMHVHHPPQSETDSYHVVALTSTTLGSLNHINTFRFANGKVGDCDGDGDGFTFANAKVKNSKGNRGETLMVEIDEEEEEDKNRGFSMGLIEAKTWSTMIEQKIPKALTPKTPTRTPPGEPETINTWELMEGLEDASPFRSPNHFRSFSFDRPKSPKPTWGEEDESNHLNFDPEVISAFRKSLEELSPDSPFHLRKQSTEENRVDEEKKQRKVVLYFTSLRGVRKTYEDCCHVRLILRGLGVRVDERDVSMHSGFKEELKELLVEKQGINNGVGLPRVFIGRDYVGGAEEIQRLHEDGKLEKLLSSCEKVDQDDGHGGDGGRVCEACGDIRFVPCETCSGSCKIYYEEEEEEQEQEEEDGEFNYRLQNSMLRGPPKSWQYFVIRSALVDIPDQDRINRVKVLVRKTKRRRVYDIVLITPSAQQQNAV